MHLQITNIISKFICTNKPNHVKGCRINPTNINHADTQSLWPHDCLVSIRWKADIDLEVHWQEHCLLKDIRMMFLHCEVRGYLDMSVHSMLCTLCINSSHTCQVTLDISRATGNIQGNLTGMLSSLPLCASNLTMHDTSSSNPFNETGICWFWYIIKPKFTRKFLN